jgi:hypothetical protein
MFCGNILRNVWRREGYAFEVFDRMFLKIDR